MPQFSDLDRLSDEEIKQLWTGVLELRTVPSGRALIRRAVEEVRSGKFSGQSYARPIKMPEGFDPFEQLSTFIDPEENQSE